MKDVIIISAEGSIVSAGPLYVASLLIDHGYTAATLQCLDYMDDDKIQNLIDLYFTHEKQILGVSLTFARSNHSLATLSKFIIKVRDKFPNIKIVAGGANSIDYVKSRLPEGIIYVLGQNRENDIIDTFNKLSGRIIKKPFDFKNFSVNYKALFPKVAPKGVIMYLDLSRGCYFNCVFCNYNLRGSKSNFKNRDQISKEINEFYEVFGTSDIFLLCNTFNESIDKIRELKEASKTLPFIPSYFAFTRVDLLMSQPEEVKEFYKDFVRYVFLGIESLNPQTLRSIRKSVNVEKIKQFLIDFRKDSLETHVMLSFIVGLPNDSYDNHAEVAKWINENGVYDSAIFHPLRINDVDTTIGLNEFSDIEKNPGNYGYIISKEGSLLFGKNSKKTFDGPTQIKDWVRTDGYSSIKSVEDSLKLNAMVDNGFQFPTHMVLSSFGKKIPNKTNFFSPRNTLLNVGISQPEPINDEKNILIQNASFAITEFIQSYYNSLVANA